MDSYAKKNAVKNSKLITCPKCGSKVNKDYITIKYALPEPRKPILSCPVCRNDLYSDTVKKRIEKYLSDIETLEKTIKKKKESQKAPISWLMKVEVHC